MGLEKKAQADKVMVSMLPCSGLPDSRLPSAGWMGGRRQMMNQLSLHPSDLGQGGNRGNHIRDRKLDLDDLRFFQGSLRDKTESPFTDILSIPLCFLLTWFLQGQWGAQLKGNPL